MRARTAPREAQSPPWMLVARALKTICALPGYALLGYALLGCALLALVPLLSGCSQRALPGGQQVEVGASDGAAADGGACVGCTCKDPLGDADGDGIANGEEGCKTARDTDGDKIPDWQDLDSDDDGISDETEAGDKDSGGRCKGSQQQPPKDAWPCDSDGDGLPDYLDVDSDGDGLQDGDEDANGDGLLGCCLASCNKPQGKQGSCQLTADGCGPGQTCLKGACTPATSFDCSDGETDPTKKFTFPPQDDASTGTFICRDATADNPSGRRPIQRRKSAAGDWQVALETTAKYAELSISGAGKKEAAAVIDMAAAKSEVAGFVVSLGTTHASVSDALAAIFKNLAAKPPAGPGSVTLRASGTLGKSHDHYDAVTGTILDLSLTKIADVPAVRDALVGALLGRTTAQLGLKSSSYGSYHATHVIRFTTVKRFEFKRDKDGDLVDKDGKKLKASGGDPVDSGDKTKWRLLLMGAVAGKSYYADPKRDTGFNVDDLSGGTALARHGDAVLNECDVDKVPSLPKADIIWVIDESGSMSDSRTELVNNANNFFSRALSSGLDFRMGVTGVVSQPSSCQGKLCSKISTNSSDDGGVDRFLLPSEQSIFASCIKNPPCYEGGTELGLVNAKQAVKRHLPRAANVASKIRTGAQLVIIVVSDEVPYSLTAALGGASNFKQCTLDAATGTKLDAALAPYLALFDGSTDPEAAAVFHVVGGVCNNSCGADVAHGYRELAAKLGGQLADVCQLDLGSTMQVIIDSIVGSSSPLQLEYVPISSSLAVALDGVAIKRSRTNGFDYRAAHNALVLINVKYGKGGELIASYKRWMEPGWLGP